MDEPVIVHTKEEIPDSPPEATYVVVDVFRFSTSVLTLLEEGATSVKAAASIDEVRAFANEREDSVVGGESRHSDPLFDIRNSPTQITQVDVVGRAACLYSDNGARTVERVQRAGDVYVGTTLNAGAVGRMLREVDGDVFLVATGADGAVQHEDVVCAQAIRQFATSETVPEAELETYRLAIEGNNARYESSGLTAKDAELVTQFDTSDTIPTVDGDGHIVPRSASVEQ